MENLLTLLTVLFVGLKLTDQIDWSWWLVLAPAYGGLAVALVVLAVFVILEATKQLRRGRYK